MHSFSLLFPVLLQKKGHNLLVIIISLSLLSHRFNPIFVLEKKFYQECHILVGNTSVRQEDFLQEMEGYVVQEGLFLSYRSNVCGAWQ